MNSVYLCIQLLCICEHPDNIHLVNYHSCNVFDKAVTGYWTKTGYLDSQHPLEMK